MSEPLDLAALRRVAEAYVEAPSAASTRIAYWLTVTPEAVLELVRRVEEAEGKR